MNGTEGRASLSIRIGWHWNAGSKHARDDLLLLMFLLRWVCGKQIQCLPQHRQALRSQRPWMRRTGMSRDIVLMVHRTLYERTRNQTILMDWTLWQVMIPIRPRHLSLTTDDRTPPPPLPRTLCKLCLYCLVCNGSWRSNTCSDYILEIWWLHSHKIVTRLLAAERTWPANMEPCLHCQ